MNDDDEEPPELSECSECGVELFFNEEYACEVCELDPVCSKCITKCDCDSKENPMTTNPADLTAEELGRLDALRKAATQQAVICWYEHGGGRYAIYDGPDAKIVADFYHRNDRDYYTSLIPDTVGTLIRMARRAVSAEKERNTYHDTLCALTTELLPGRGCWTTDELMEAIHGLRSELKDVDDPDSVGSPTWLASRMQERAEKAESQLATLRAEREPPKNMCPQCESDVDTEEYEGGGFVCVNCNQDFDMPAAAIRAIPATT